MKPKVRIRRCYGCEKRARSTRAGDLFCSLTCAAEYANAIVEGNDDLWCPTCDSYEGVYVHGERNGAPGPDWVPLQCGHFGHTALRVVVRAATQNTDSTERSE